MPDANGNIKGFTPTRKTAAAWERIFGRPTRGHRAEAGKLPQPGVKR